MSDPLSHIQILQQCDDAVERGLDHRLLVERDERALLVGFDFVDDELDLLHTDIVILCRAPGPGPSAGSARPAWRLSPCSADWYSKKRRQQRQQRRSTPRTAAAGAGNSRYRSSRSGAAIMISKAMKGYRIRRFTTSVRRAIRSITGQVLQLLKLGLLGLAQAILAKIFLLAPDRTSRRSRRSPSRSTGGTT